MNKNEQSLLLYLETCLVDFRGKVDGRRMNKEDFEIVKKFKEERLVDFGRLPASEVFSKKPKFRSHYTHYVRFSPKAWELVHRLRRERAERHVDTIGKWETLEITKGEERFWIGILDEKGKALEGFCYHAGYGMLPPNLVLFKNKELAKKILEKSKEKNKSKYKIYSSKQIKQCPFSPCNIDTYKQWEEL